MNWVFDKRTDMVSDGARASAFGTTLYRTHFGVDMDWYVEIPKVLLSFAGSGICYALTGSQLVAAVSAGCFYFLLSWLVEG